MGTSNPNPITKDCPVRAPDWNRMMDRLLAYPQLRFLRDLKRKPAMQAVLMPPVTLALWIRRFMPELADRSSVRIVIAGAAELDGMHEGRWFQLVPYLLGRPQLQLDVTILYQNVSQYPAAVSGDWLRPVSARLDLATESTATLGTWLAKNPDNPDLLVLFHPGFEYAASGGSHDGIAPACMWLDESELPAALGRGIPVAVTAFEEIEFEQDRWPFDAYGIKAAPDTLQNPFVTDKPYALETPPMGWGSFLWRIDPTSGFEPVPDTHPVREANARLGAFASQYGRGRLVDLWNLGRPMTLRQYVGGAPADVIMLDGQFAIDPDNGDILLVSEDAASVDEIDLPVKLDADLVRRYPRNPAFLFERTVWGAEALHETFTQVAAAAKRLQSHAGSKTWH
jgi:hypothetical protein